MYRRRMVDVATMRLLAHRLVGAPFDSALDAVGALGAVQAQDYAGARWALALRVPSATGAALDGALDSGAILRTHVLRPTWHLVRAHDVRWMLALTGPRIRATLGGRLRQLELDEPTVTRALGAITASLEGARHRTRSELAEVLRTAGIAPEGQRLPHLIMAAELEGLIVSGRLRGRQHTYALLAERAPAVRVLDRDEAVAELVLRYFRSHGPAQARDFAWWSGLTLSDTRRGIAAAGAALEQRVIDGETHWFDPAVRPARGAARSVHLLPNWDEFTVAYRDRSALVNPASPVDPALLTFGSLLANVVTVGGRVRGGWRLRPHGGSTRLEVRTDGPLTAREADGVEAAALRMETFLERSVAVAWSS